MIYQRYRNNECKKSTNKCIRNNGSNNNELLKKLQHLNEPPTKISNSLIQ